jgi:hypothetical protein
MSRVYKTAKGKMVDMDKIKLANETSIAVGNMKVNARGDAIGSDGQIAAGRNQIMDRVYAVDPPPYTPNSPANMALREAEMQNNKAKELHNLVNNLVPESASVEPTVDTESPQTTKTRGSLASAVAKTATVTQEPIPDPRKSKGPTRI